MSNSSELFSIRHVPRVTEFLWIFAFFTAWFGSLAGSGVSCLFGDACYIQLKILHYYPISVSSSARRLDSAQLHYLYLCVTDPGSFPDQTPQPRAKSPALTHLLALENNE